MKNNKLWLIIMIVSIIAMLNLFACGNAGQMQSGLHDFIKVKATKVLEQLKADQPKYNIESANLANYQSQLETLLKPKEKGFGSFYDELQLVEGYWISDGKNIKNITWLKTTTTESGQYYVIPNSYRTGTLIVEMYDRLKSIYDYQEKLNWAKICEVTLASASTDARVLEKVLNKLELSYGGWTIKPNGRSSYISVGDVLGVYDNAPCYGSWYINLYKDKNEYLPADKEAENLLTLITEGNAYEIKKRKSDTKPPLISISQRTIHNLTDILNYFSSNGIRLGAAAGGGVGSGTGVTEEVKFIYAKSSPEVQDLFKKYPDFKRYWDMLETLGCNIVCATYYSAKGFADFSEITKSSQGNAMALPDKPNPEPIILRVSR